eukprot:g4688.t1
MIANEALANELVKIKAETKKDRHQLHQDVDKLSKELKDKTEQEIALHDALKTHDARIRELQKRLRDEHYLKTKAESQLQGMSSKMEQLRTEMEQLLQQRACHDQQLSDLSSSKQLLQDQLSNSQKQLEQFKQKETDTETKLVNQFNYKDSKHIYQRLNGLKEEHGACVERAKYLEGTLNSLTTKFNQLTLKHQTLQDKEVKQKVTCEQLLNEKTELKAELKSLQEIKESLTEELNSVHDILSKERVLAAKYQVKNNFQDLKIEHDNQNETRKLDNELSVAQSTVESLKQNNEHLEEERSDLKIELKNERSKNREVEKRYKETKEKMESLKKENEKREAERTTEFKTKLTNFQSELKKKETSHMAEIRKYKLSLEEIKEELSSVNETIETLKQERNDLLTKSRTLANSLSHSEDKNRLLTQDLADSEEEIQRSKDQLATLEDRVQQINTAHEDRLTKLNQDLQREALLCVQLKEQKANLENNLTLREAELRDFATRTKTAISERDQQINQLGDSVKTLSVNLKSTKEAAVKEKENFKKQISEINGQKETLKTTLDSQKREATSAQNEIDLLKKELSRLTLLLTEKESEVHSIKKSTDELIKEHQECIKNKDSTISELKQKLEDKAKIVEDLLSAMQSEESSRKLVQKNLEMTNERNRILETQLTATNASLERAVSDSYSAMEAYETMKEKAEVLKTENSSLLKQYEDWAVRIADDNRSGQAKKQFKTAANSVLAKQRLESGAYSERLVNLMKRRDSMKSNPQ